MPKPTPPASTPLFTQVLQSAPVMRVTLDDRATLRQAHEARHAALVADAVREIREGMVGGTPDLLDQGLGGAATGRAGDRLGSPKPGQGSDQFEDPLGRYGVSGKLGNRRPRSSVVGPGAIPGQDSLTSYVITDQVSHPGGGTTEYQTTYRDSETGDTARVRTVTYDSDHNLVSWSETFLNPDGSGVTLNNKVESESDKKSPVVDTEMRTLGPGGIEVGPPAKWERPIGEAGDPPIEDPTNATRSQPADEGSAGPGGMALPFGITYNFMTGRYTAGMKLGNDQVNPGRDGGQPATVPAVQIDPRILVINPDPENSLGQGELRVIPRGPLTPGERPPNPS